MRLSIDQHVCGLFPHLKIGVMNGTALAVKAGCKTIIDQMRHDAEAHLHSVIPAPESLGEHPHISAWHDAYGKFGVKAKKFNPTHEALARRLLRGKGWPSIHPLVDVYLTNQVFHLLPHGGHDVTSINCNISLRISPGGEPFQSSPDAEAETTGVGEIVYADMQRVLTRRWNYRDCFQAQITEQTQRLVLMVEIPSAEIARDMLQGCMVDLCDRYRRCFEGEFNYKLLEPQPETYEFNLMADQF